MSDTILLNPDTWYIISIQETPAYCAMYIGHVCDDNFHSTSVDDPMCEGCGGFPSEGQQFLIRDAVLRGKGKGPVHKAGSIWPPRVDINYDSTIAEVTEI